MEAGSRTEAGSHTDPGSHTQDGSHAGGMLQQAGLWCRQCSHSAQSSML